MNKEKADKYKKLSKLNLEDLKKNLTQLKEDKIYDYEKRNINVKLYTSLYEKKEAIDFLLKKTNQDISVLYERLDPTNRIITIKDIQDIEECIKIFNKLKESNDI